MPVPDRNSRECLHSYLVRSLGFRIFSSSGIYPAQRRMIDLPEAAALSNAPPRPLRGDSLGGLHLLDRLGHRDYPLCAFHVQVLDQLAVDDHNALAACACR